MAELHYLDYIILAATLAASFSIGIYHAVTSRRNPTVTKYLIADRKMKPIPVATSLVISTFSSIAVLSDAAEMYYYGAEFWFCWISLVLAFIITGKLFVPLFYPLKLTSVHQVSPRS